MTAWDELLDRIDHLVASRALLTDELATELATLVGRAMDEGTADRELDADDCGRWLVALLRAETSVHDGDTSLATLRTIVTRWLHPGRLDPGHTFDAPI